MSDQSVTDELAARIAKDGPISIAVYMDVVAENYYARGEAFGKDGDFITAPEISQVFGELVGLWCATAWQALDQPRLINLVEFGPGRGTLMADALRTVSDVAAPFFKAASLHLIERSRALRAQQQHSLRDYDVEWHDDLSMLPYGPVIFIGNEFLDALPIRQFEKMETGWHERLIEQDDGGFAFVAAPIPSDAIDHTYDDSPAGSILEQSDAIQDIVKQMAQCCVERHGVALMIDYGHTHSDVGDTLQAVQHHSYHPVLEAPGTADLTAHVDFAAIKQVARSEGAHVYGPVEQGLWLNRLGAPVREAQLCEGKSSEDASIIKDSIHRLIAPDGMGTLFKVIAFASPKIGPLAGFEVQV